MKITKRVLSLLLPGMAAASLLVACSDDDSGSNGNGGNDQGAAGAPTVIVNTGFECPEPGESFCNGSASGIVCADGSTTGVPFTCAQGEVCEDGACVGQCEAKATECVGKQAYRICSDDGKQWVPVACQSGEECVDGACESTAPACTAGEKQCDGDTVQTCKADGSGWDEAECPSGTECTDGGECAGVCTVGETRCDPSTLDLAQVMFSEGPFGGEYANNGIVWKCVDGTKWELEPCASGEFCTYSGIDEAEVARYKSDLFAFGMGLIFAEGSGPQIPAFPKPPAIPAGAQASCTADACGLQGDEEPFFSPNGPFTFFETAGVRECGAPGDGEEDSPYAKLSACTGLPPYQAFEVTTVECPADTMCTPGYPERGCGVPECDPDESYCDGNDIVSCDPYYLEQSWQWCEYGCTESGESPTRSAVCNLPPE
jgi:hypothetical protein